MAKTKKSKPITASIFIGQLVHHTLDSPTFTLLVLEEHVKIDDGVATKNYTIFRKEPRNLSDTLFAYGHGPTARVAVGNFFAHCADANKPFNQGVSFGYADAAVLEFCNTEMFDDLQAQHDANLKAQSNG